MIIEINKSVLNPGDYPNAERVNDEAIKVYQSMKGPSPIFETVNDAIDWYNNLPIKERGRYWSWYEEEPNAPKMPHFLLHRHIILIKDKDFEYYKASKGEIIDTDEAYSFLIGGK